MSEKKNSVPTIEEESFETSPIVPVEEAIKEVKETKRAKAFILSLYDINIDLIKNPRADCTGDHVENIRNTIGDNRHNEQLSPVNATIVTVDGIDNVAIYAGFTRFEAMSRTALKPVIEKWNTDNNLEPKDENYVDPLPDKGFEARKDREKVLSAGGNWQKLYNEALKSFPIKVEVMPTLNDFTTFYKSFTENTARENMPAWNVAQALQEMKERFKVSWKTISAKVGMKQQTISQYNAVFSIPQHLEAMFDEDKEGLKLTDADKKLAVICKDEFVRRASLPVKDPRAVQMSHGRILGQALSQRANNGLNFKDGVKLLCALCKINPDGSLNPSHDAANYGVFETMISNLKAKKTAETTSENFAQSDDALAKMFGGISTGDIADLQKVQDAASEIGITTEGELDMNAIMSEVNKQVKSDEAAAKTDEKKPSSATLIEDSLIGDIIGVEDIDDDDDDASGVDIDASDLLSGVVDTSNDSLAGLLGDEAKDLTTKNDKKDDEEITGERRTSTIEVSETELRVKPVDKIVEKISVGKILATTCLEDVEDSTEVNWIEFLGTMSGIVILTEIIGDKANNKKFAPLVNSVSEALGRTWRMLMDHAKKTMNAEQFSKVSGLLPDIEVKSNLEE